MHLIEGSKSFLLFFLLITFRIMTNPFIHPNYLVIILILVIYSSIFLIAIGSATGRLFFILVGLVVAWFWVSCATGLVIAFTFIVSNPLNAAYCFIGFIFAGIIVALLKWRSKILKEINDEIKLLETHNDIKLLVHLNKNIENVTSSAQDCKVQISGWILFWPLHVIDSLVTLVFHDLFDKIADYTRVLFDYITERVTKSAIESYKKKSEQNNSKLTK